MDGMVGNGEKRKRTELESSERGGSLFWLVSVTARFIYESLSMGSRLLVTLIPASSDLYITGFAPLLDDVSMSWSMKCLVPQWHSLLINKLTRPSSHRGTWLWLPITTIMFPGIQDNSHY